jgi:histidinol-phosphate aminotransferase
MPEGFDLMLGNGSDELISLLAMACDVPGASILAPLPGFVMYGMSAQLQGLKFVGVDLTPTSSSTKRAMLDAIAEHQPSIIYLAYPNNPTANLWDDAVIEKIVEAAPGLVVMDEAYQPFASRSYIDRIAATSHVLLMRTLSKFGLAGVRIGYMMGPGRLIARGRQGAAALQHQRAQLRGALFALEHEDVFAAQAGRSARERARLLMDRAGRHARVKAWPSDANMILVRVPDARPRLRGHEGARVLVKNVSRMHPLLANCLRLTVGTADENAQMLAAPCYDAPMTERTAEVTRNTAETQITVRVNLDGTGQASPGHRHRLLRPHAGPDRPPRADRPGHPGQGRPAHRRPPHGGGRRHHARPGRGQGRGRQEGHPPLRPRLRAARRGAVARGDRLLGPPGLVMNVPFKSGMIGTFDTQLAHEFFQGFVNHAFVTLHIDNLRGDNAHHQCETVFKAFARALRMALEIDPRAAGVIPSTKARQPLIP